MTFTVRESWIYRIYSKVLRKMSSNLIKWCICSTFDDLLGEKSRSLEMAPNLLVQGLKWHSIKFVPIILFFCELKVNKSCITTQLLLQELIHYHEKNSWFFQPDQADIIALGKLYLVPVLMDLGALVFNVLNWGTAETIWILLQNGFTKNNIAAKNKEEMKNRGYNQIHCPCFALLVINWQSTAQPF